MNYIDHCPPLELDIAYLIRENINEINLIKGTNGGILESCEHFLSELTDASKVRSELNKPNPDYDSIFISKLIKYWSFLSDLCEYLAKSNNKLDLRRKIEYRGLSGNNKSSHSLWFECACISLSISSLFSHYGHKFGLAKDYKKSTRYYNMALFFFESFMSINQNGDWSLQFGNLSDLSTFNILLEVRWMDVLTKSIKKNAKDKEDLKKKSLVLMRIYYSMTNKLTNAEKGSSRDSLTKYCKVAAFSYTLKYSLFRLEMFYNSYFMGSSQDTKDVSNEETATCLNIFFWLCKTVVIKKFKKPEIELMEKSRLVYFYGISFNRVMDRIKKLMVRANRIVDMMKKKNIENIISSIGLVISEDIKGVMSIWNITGDLKYEAFKISGFFQECESVYLHFDTWTLWCDNIKVPREYKKDLKKCIELSKDGEDTGSKTCVTLTNEQKRKWRELMKKYKEYIGLIKQAMSKNNSFSTNIKLGSIINSIIGVEDSKEMIRQYKQGNVKMDSQNIDNLFSYIDECIEYTIKRIK
jgi:hypothetical protein